MLIRDLFRANVTRDIPPVVYFHEQSPAKLHDEVSEYIITGGYPEGDPRARRVSAGIHEQFVHLLRQLRRELDKPAGPELPASWISGFFGSGKSSFAKLLGLALDGASLPDGRPLAQALLDRDDSPRRQELQDAWHELHQRIDPMAVVFDIGAVARDNEHVHAAVLRQIQTRLGYCDQSDLVAWFEMKLERDGEWDAFLAAAQKTLGRPWAQARLDAMADDHFSHVMHVLHPARFRDQQSWIISRAGSREDIDSSVKAVTDAIEHMLRRRAPDKTLFVVVDEVSQYVHKEDDRMLKLQTLVSQLGQRLKGRVWLLATGQQKLEDQSKANNLGKLKDRFPQALRVHLATSNIRDVVHKRLLRKAPSQEAALRALFQRHRQDLRLYGYSCDEVTEEDFLEVYPMLPGHVDLLMQITSQLRTRSSARAQGDDQAIRGLLQLLGELFRSQRLAERPVGDLVTLDAIFEVQQSALEPDVQTTLARIFDHPEAREQPLWPRVAKAVALLELLQEQLPTTADLIAKCLYQRLGDGNQRPAVEQTLDQLQRAGLLSRSEKQGYKIQSSAGQEWQRERDDHGVTSEAISEHLRQTLEDLLGLPERPRYRGQPFQFAAFFSDGRAGGEQRIKDPRTDAAVVVDFRYHPRKEDRASAPWIERSNTEALRDRLLWVVGEPGRLNQLATDLLRAQHMVERYESRRASLGPERQRLLVEEQNRAEDLDRQLHDACAEAFLDGALYFRGRPIRPQDFGGSFALALQGVANRLLPDLFPHFPGVAVTDGEFAQLLEPTLSGPSAKFLEGPAGLGILALDAGKYVASCAGAAPSSVLAFLSESGGTTGASVLAHFCRPPYGFPADVVRACLLGLLRAGKLRLRPEGGVEITSIKDPGVRDLFGKDRELRRAEIFPPREEKITPRDRVAICAFFKRHLDLDLERDNDAIADAVFQQFAGRRDRLREVEALLDRLPNRPRLPAALERLGKALEDCRRSRLVEDTVVAVKRNLEALADGLQQLGMLRSELSEEALAAVAAAAAVRDDHLRQLRALGPRARLAEHDPAVQLLDEQLGAERPWRDIAALQPALAQLRAHYIAVRRELLTEQGRKAEAARAQVQGRDGFARLSADQAHAVLRPIMAAPFDTTAEALHPTLAEMLDRFPQALEQAQAAANDQLDALLSRLDQKPLVKLDPRLSGLEITSREALRAVLAELEERITAQLDQGSRVRLV